ncbi:MAG: RNase H-like domain-containing protein, partial [Candidatus Thiodiazotropha endolucinida]|nr:hypothetical protein [Candidatus Thiodiazotropha taylori]MCW4342165.1 RNase H-like domain-containing protein [Candidatus Thiodiazotropha endolucinida]
MDKFITSLYTLAEHCNYGNLKNELIRDRIVVGLRDAKISEKLQLDADLTLETAVNQARQKEAVHQQQSIVRSQISDNKLDSVKYKQRRGQNSRQRTLIRDNVKQQNREKPKCTRCGAVPAHGRNNCPARDSKCRGCGIKGHWVRFCLSKKVHEVDDRDEESDVYLGTDESGVYLGTIESRDSSDDSASLESVNSGSEPWTIDLKVGPVCIRFKIDTGADCTVISDKTYLNLGKLPLDKCSKRLYGPGNVPLEVMGSFSAKLESNTSSAVERIYVVKGLDRCLLGRPAISKLNLLEIKCQNASVNEVISIETVKERYPNLFKELGMMSGEYDITLKEGAKPHALSVPRRVPIPLLPKVRQELDNMEKNGVISRVDQPSDWCAGLVVVPKTEAGKIRICVDLTHLNENVKRENFPLPAIDQSLGLLSGAKYFSKIDLNFAFWQILLSSRCKMLTTFITPFGRYVFNRLPMGLSSSSEYLQKRMTQLLEGIDGVICQTDDVLVYGRTETEHDERLHIVLSRLHGANLTINPSKCEFKKTSIKYVGHIISSSGITADPERVKGITGMNAPTDVHGVRRFLGMVNQLQKFTPLLAEYSKPIRDLLSNKNQFYWGPDQQKSFELIKQLLTNTPVLALYDPNRKTVLKTDASSYGLGCALFQEQENGDMKPVSYASRALSPTEQRYSTIEKEALAITFGCEKNRDFLIGKTFHIETDHLPLISLLGGRKGLNDLPLRIMRFRMRLMPFSYTISHVGGKAQIISDALSRSPVIHSLTEEEQKHSLDTESYVDMIIYHLPATDLRLQEIREKQNKDVICQTLSNYCINGWPKKKQNATKIGKVYWPFRGEITINRGLLMKGDRIIIPTEMKQDILSKIHGAHQGITKCKMRAKESVWWLGINADIENLIKSCDTCAKLQNDHSEPMISTEFDDRPWKHLGSDLFFWKGHTYLLVVCYYSRFIELAKLNSATSEEIINHLKSMFSRFGV